MSLNLPVIPYDASSTGCETDIVWQTIVSTSESNIAGRKSLQPYPVRQMHLTSGPSEVAEVRAIFNACFGKRYPVAMRDWSDYKFTDQVCLYEGSGGSGDTRVQLQQLYQPATGGRSFTQPILIPDQTEVALTLKVNGSPYGGTFTVLDYGIVDLHTVLTSGDTITASGEKLVPCCFLRDTMTIKSLTSTVMEIADVQLREIFKQELIDLTGVADPLA